MKYNTNCFLQFSETPILSGTIMAGVNAMYLTLYDFCLTEQKIIFSAENDLRVFSLNLITEAYIIPSSPNHFAFFIGGRSFVIQLPANPEWANKIVYEICKRVGR